MFEIAGGILLALIVIVLVIALLPQVLWAIVIAFWAAITVALIVGLTVLWSEMGLATVLIVGPVLVVAFLYWLGADKARWDRAWSF